MKKTISILSIISVVVASVSLLLGVIFLTIFWEPASRIYASDLEVIAEGPILPIGNMFNLVACLLIVVAVCVFSGTNRTIVLEIIAVVLLSFVIPVLVECLSMAQAAIISKTMGIIKYTVLMVAENISDIFAWLMAISKSLCLVVCGMSISKKVIAKRTASKESKAIE